MDAFPRNEFVRVFFSSSHSSKNLMVVTFVFFWVFFQVPNTKKHRYFIVGALRYLKGQHLVRGKITVNTGSNTKNPRLRLPFRLV